MMRRLALPFLCIGLTLSFATSSSAWDHTVAPDGIPSQDLAREAKFLVRQFRSTMAMQDQPGAQKASIQKLDLAPRASTTSAAQHLLNLGGEDLKKHEGLGASTHSDGYGDGDGYGGGGTGPLPGDRGDGFARFLQNGLQQAQGKSSQEGLRTLRTFVRRALEIGGGSVPLGVQVALRGADQAAEKCKYYSERFEALGMTVRFVLDNPGAFRGDPNKEVYVLAKVAQIAISGVGENESQYKFLQRFLAEMQRAYGKQEPRVRGMTMEAISRASDSAKYFSERAQFMKAALARFQRGIVNLGHTFEVIVEATQGLSEGESRFKTQQAMFQTFASNKGFFPNVYTHQLLLVGMQTAGNFKYYSGRAEAQITLAKILTRAIKTPGQYFQAGLQVAATSSESGDRWSMVSKLTETALRFNFLQSFDAELLRTQYQEAQRRRYYSEKYDELSRALRQIR